MPVLDALPEDSAEEATPPQVGTVLDALPDEATAPDSNVTVLYPNTNRVVSAPKGLSANEITYHDGVQNQGLSPRDSVGYSKAEPTTFETVKKWLNPGFALGVEAAKDPQAALDQYKYLFDLPFAAATHSLEQFGMNVPKSINYAMRVGAGITGTTEEVKPWADQLARWDNKVSAQIEKDFQSYHEKLGIGFDALGFGLTVPALVAAGPIGIAVMAGGASESGYEQSKKEKKSELTSLTIGAGTGIINAKMMGMYWGKLVDAIQNDTRPLVSKVVAHAISGGTVMTGGSAVQEALLQTTGVSHKSASEVLTELGSDFVLGAAGGAAGAMLPAGFPGTIKPIGDSGGDSGKRPPPDDPPGGSGIVTGSAARDAKITDIMLHAGTKFLTPEQALVELRKLGVPDPEKILDKLPEVKKIISDKASEFIDQDIQKANDNPKLVTDTLDAMVAAHEGDTLTLKALLEKDGHTVPPELQDIFDEIETQKTLLKAREEKAAQVKAEDTDPKVIAARSKKLDSDLTALDLRIDDQMTRISDLNKAGRSQKAAENKLESMLNKRADMADELAGLETADTRLGSAKSAEPSVASEPITINPNDPPVQGEHLDKEFAAHAKNYPDTQSGAWQAAKDWVTQKGSTSGKEHGVIIDSKTGRVIKTIVGTDRTISTKDIEKELSDPNYALILHHNHLADIGAHKDGGPISGSDLQVVANPGALEIISHDAKGASSSAKFTAPVREFLDGKSTEGRVDQARMLHQPVRQETIDFLRKLVSEGKISFDEGNRMAGEVINRILDKAGVIDYASDYTLYDKVKAEVEDFIDKRAKVAYDDAQSRGAKYDYVPDKRTEPLRPDTANQAVDSGDKEGLESRPDQQAVEAGDSGRRGDSETSGRYSSERAERAQESLNKDVTVKGETIAKAARDKASARIDAIAKGMKLGKVYGRDETYAVQRAMMKIVSDFIKNSPHLDPSEKAKFITPLIKMNTFEKLQKNMPLLQSMLRNAEAKAGGKAARETVNTELSDIKPKTTDGKKEGKFTADIQEHLTTLAKYNKLSQEKAADELGKRLNVDDEFTPEQKMENRLLAAVASGQKTAPDQWQQIADHIQQVKKEGKAARQEKKDEVKQRRQEIRDLYLKNSPRKSEKSDDPGVARGAYISTARVWGDRIARLTRDPKLRKYLTTFDERETYLKNKADATQGAEDRIVKDLGLKNYKELIKYQGSLAKKVRVGEFTDANGNKETINLPRHELISIALKLRQEDGNNSIRSQKGNAYTDDMIAGVLKELTPTDFKYIDSLIEVYGEKAALDRFSNFYEDLTGVPFPYIENYSPLARTDFDQPQVWGDWLNPKFIASGFTPGLAKSRTGAETALRFPDPMTELIAHIDKREKYIAMSSKLRDLMAFVRHPDVKARIVRNHGEEFHKELVKNIEGMALTKPLDNRLTKGVYRLANNLAFSKIAAKISMAPIQASSMITSLAEAPSFGAWLKGVGKTVAHPVETLKTVWESPTIKNRYGRGLAKGNISIDYEAMKSSYLMQKLKGYKNVHDALLVSASAGDMTAVGVGGSILYHSFEGQKGADGKELSHEEILKRVSKWVDETQQTTNPEQLSLVQQDLALRAMLLFRSAPMAQYNAAVRYAREFKEGPKDLTSMRKLTRQMLGTWILPSIFYQAVATLFTSDWRDYAKAAIVGPFNSMLLIGEGVDYLVGNILGAKSYVPQAPGIYSLYDKYLRDLDKEVGDAWDNIANGEDIDATDAALTIIKTAGRASQPIIGTPDVLIEHIPRGIYYLEQSEETGDESQRAATASFAGFPKSVAGKIGGKIEKTDEQKERDKEHRAARREKKLESE